MFDLGRASLADVEQVLTDAVDRRLWGEVSVQFQAGRPVLIRKTETIKPANGEPDGERRSPDL